MILLIICLDWWVGLGAMR